MTVEVKLLEIDPADSLYCYSSGNRSWNSWCHKALCSI